VKVLAVETATAWQSVAILDDDRVLASHSQEAAGAHGTLLLPAIDRLLSETRLTLTGLDGLACSVGPGSFTGLRVGMATCLGLRDATGLPLVLVSTLEAMAWNGRDVTIPLCPVLICRKGEVYWAVFRWIDGQLERLVSDCVGSTLALGRSLTAETMVFGEGWSMNEAEIRQHMPPAVAVIGGSAERGRPSAVNVGLVGLGRLHRGQVAGVQVSPHYVQRAEAEIRYEQSGGMSPVARRQERVTRKMGVRLARVRPAGDRQGKFRKSNG
jgi:tRNA threonylcarbamoyladenosine biosynthesis protein TsaB